MAIDDAVPNFDATGDLGPLAWIIEELSKSLTQAQKSLRLYLREQLNLQHAAGGKRVRPDAAPLNDACRYLHQSIGALDLVDLPAAASLLRAVNGAVARFIEEPAALDGHVVDVIDHACFALVDFLQLKLAGKPVVSVALFPQYREVATLAGMDRIHPADVWNYHPWQWIEPAAALPASAAGAPNAGMDTRARFDNALLELLRGHIAAGVALRDLCLGLAGRHGQTLEFRTFWKIAAGFFDGVERALVPLDLYAKRAAGRVLSQYTAFQRGNAEASVPLARDLVFFIAMAGQPRSMVSGGAFEVVRSAYELRQSERVDYDKPIFGRFDPALLRVARQRVGAAKAAWSSLCSGEPVKREDVMTDFAAVGQTLRQLVPDSERFASALENAVAACARVDHPPAAQPALEIATAALYVEAVFADMAFGDPQLHARLEELANRIEAVQQGGKSQALPAWIEELYRRVNDRKTIGSVVGELRVSLGKLEKSLDTFFRRPEDTTGIPEALTELQRMRGVLSVLGLAEASRATQCMEQQVTQLSAMPANQTGGERDGLTASLGRSLGALGFMIDMLNYQPALARQLFVFDENLRELRSTMGSKKEPSLPVSTAADETETATPAQSPSDAFAELASAPDGHLNDQVASDMGLVLGRLAEQAEISEQPALAAKAKEAAAALAQAQSEAQRAQVVAHIADAIGDTGGTRPSAPASSAVGGGTPLVEDDLRDVFLEEAHEVIASGREGAGQLEADPGNADALGQARRAFHTLKGSSRMVGLTDFGEAAWACEQCCNSWIASGVPVSGELVAFTRKMLDCFEAWIADLEGNKPTSQTVEAFQRAAQAVIVPSAETSAPASVPAQSVSPADLQTPNEPGAVPESPLPVVPSLSETTYESVAGDLPADWGQPTLPMDIDAHMQEEPPAPSLSGLDLPSLDLPGHLPEIPLHEPSAPSLPTEVITQTHAASGAGIAPAAPEGDAPEPNPVRRIGSLEVSEALYNIYLGEADTWSSELETTLNAWDHTHESAALIGAEARAHSLAGSSATVGFVALSRFARLLEHAIGHMRQVGSSSVDPYPAEPAVLARAASEIRALLHQFAAGFLKEPAPELTRQLEAFEQWQRPPDVLQGLDVQEEENASGDTAELNAGGSSTAEKSWVETEAVPLLGERDQEPRAQAEEPAATHPTVAEATPVVPHEVPEAPSLDTDAAVQAELLGVFREEATDLIPDVARHLREWASGTGDGGPALQSVLRGLHTLKGSARLAGVFQLGDMAHDLESALQQAVRSSPTQEQVENALDRFDAIEAAFEALQSPAQLQAAGVSIPADKSGTWSASADVSSALPTEQLPSPEEPLPSVEPKAEAIAKPAAETGGLVVPSSVSTGQKTDSTDHVPAASPAVEKPVAPPVALGGKAVVPPSATPDGASIAAPSSEVREEVDRRIAALRPATRSVSVTGPVVVPAGTSAASTLLRVRANLVDELVREVGEVAMSRSQIEGEVQRIKAVQQDLGENLERLRAQLHELELQAETQMTSRMDAARSEGHDFDPLEFDRYTRIQELTRMLAESVNDVATLQRSLQRASAAAEDELAAQGRTAKELQRGLLRTRMVEFDSIAERFHRLVRQGARECGKRAELQVVGGDIEIDRAVLERISPAFEHILRNCIVHGLETPPKRMAAGKPVIGKIVLALHQEGNDVSVSITDDGGGLDLPRIRSKAHSMHLIAPGANLSDHDVAQLIFAQGLSTAEHVTELAGRGVGMDVAHAQVVALGGHIEVAQTSERGTSFELVLPLTTAVTQIALLRIGSRNIGVPVNLVENVQRLGARERADVIRTNRLTYQEKELPAYALAALLEMDRQQGSAAADEPEAGTLQWLVLRSAGQRIALIVDEVLGNQEVVVRNIGPQFARLPGMAGMTMMPGGQIVPIYNPVALAQVYGDALKVADTLDNVVPVQPTEDKAKPVEPLVLVVDDSLTVRRVTQRLLERNGIRVALAKDGADALEKVAAERPALVLSDIEMPRMDGFEFVQHLRAVPATRDVPVVMITSRIAQKHRDFAKQLGVEHYLGKPYAEDQLLDLVRQYTTMP